MQYYFLFIILNLTISNCYSQKKDTIYISNKANCIKEVKDPQEKSTYYILSPTGRNGSFWFDENEKKSLLTIKLSTLSCNDLLKNKSFYTYIDNPCLKNNYEVYKFFNSHVTYLIKEDSVIKLLPQYAIE